MIALFSGVNCDDSAFVDAANGANYFGTVMLASIRIVGSCCVSIFALAENANGNPLAYVPNAGDNNVTVIDTNTPRLTGSRMSWGECDDYFAGRRIVAKPAITNSKVSISIAQWESVGIVAAALGIEVQVGTVIVFASVVTVPPNARALPVRFAKCPTVIPAASRIFPENVGVGDSAALGPSVVAPTGTQNTSEAQAPLVKRTLEFAPVVSAPPGRKM